MRKGMKIPVVIDESFKIAKARGKNVSFEDQDRHVEAYEYARHIYIGEIRPLPEKE